MEATNENVLSVTNGSVKRTVTTVKVYRPETGASNVVFTITKPVVLYKHTDDSDESVPAETCEVKVWMRDIRNAIDAGSIPYLLALITQAKGYLTDEVLSALAGSTITFSFTPYEKGDKYTDSNGDEQEYEHHGVKVGIKYAAITPESLQIALMGIQLKKKKF